MLNEGKYVKPGSWTWWCAVVMIALGAIMAIGQVFNIPFISQVAEVISVMFGRDIGPAALVAAGMTTIGMRGAFDDIGVRE